MVGTLLLDSRPCFRSRKPTLEPPDLDQSRPLPNAHIMNNESLPSHEQPENTTSGDVSRSILPETIQAIQRCNSWKEIETNFRQHVDLGSEHLCAQTQILRRHYASSLSIFYHVVALWVGLSKSDFTQTVEFAAWLLLSWKESLQVEKLGDNLAKKIFEDLIMLDIPSLRVAYDPISGITATDTYTSTYGSWSDYISSKAPQAKQTAKENNAFLRPIAEIAATDSDLRAVLQQKTGPKFLCALKVYLRGESGTTVPSPPPSLGPDLLDRVAQKTIDRLKVDAVNMLPAGLNEEQLAQGVPFVVGICLLWVTAKGTNITRFRDHIAELIAATDMPCDTTSDLTLPSATSGPSSAQTPSTQTVDVYRKRAKRPRQQKDVSLGDVNLKDPSKRSKRARKKDAAPDGQAPTGDDSTTFTASVENSRIEKDTTLHKSVSTQYLVVTASTGDDPGFTAIDSEGLIEPSSSDYPTPYSVTNNTASSVGSLLNPIDPDPADWRLRKLLGANDQR